MFDVEFFGVLGYDFGLLFVDDGWYDVGLC